eukprot:scaffold310_cov168-Amphora_coffeaeformis.AAC.52
MATTKTIGKSNQQKGYVIPSSSSSSAPCNVRSSHFFACMCHATCILPWSKSHAGDEKKSDCLVIPSPRAESRPARKESRQ